MHGAKAMTSMRQRFTALFCISAFLCSASGVLPAVTMLVGQFDGDHHVVVSSSGEKLQIRFHHTHDALPSKNAARGPALDEARANSSADHVIEFVNASDSLPQLPSLAALDHSLQPMSVVESERFVLVAHPCLAARYARPPPGEATWNRCRRSVVLSV